VGRLTRSEHIQAQRAAAFFAPLGPKKNPAGQGGALNNMNGQNMLKVAHARPPGNPPAAVSAAPPTIDSLIDGAQVAINPEFAQKILTEANFAGQRPVNTPHVILLADMMSRRQWTPGEVLHFVRCGGRLHLVDGQHRLAAVIHSHSSVTFRIRVTDVADEDEIIVIYWRHDRMSRRRSTPEILSAAGVAQRYGVSKTMAHAAFRATSLIMMDFKPLSYIKDPVMVRSDERRLEAAIEWWGAAQAYEHCLAECPKVLKARVHGAGITAVALVTLKYQAERAIPFWTGIAENNGLTKGDPRHTLLRDLHERGVGSGNLALWARVVATAWNAWFQGRQLATIRVFADSPIDILGTPFRRQR